MTPLFPFSIFRTRGLAAADATQMIAFAAFASVFFFLTLYVPRVGPASRHPAGADSDAANRC